MRGTLRGGQTGLVPSMGKRIVAISAWQMHYQVFFRK